MEHEEQKNQIREILRRNDYVIRAKLLDSGCIFYLPENHDSLDLDKASIEYIFSNRTVTRNIMCNNIPIKKKRNGPHYSFRLLVKWDLVRLCHLYQYDVNFIDFANPFDELISEEDFLTMLIKDDWIDITREHQLNYLFEQAFINKFDRDYSKDAKDMNVLDGYNLLYDVLVQGD